MVARDIRQVSHVRFRPPTGEYSLRPRRTVVYRVNCKLDLKIAKETRSS
jgi:hypothetical protein